MEHVRHEVLRHRMSRVLERLEGAQALLIQDPINLFYLTGIELSRGALFVHAHDAKLFVDGRYFQQCEQSAPMPVALACDVLDAACQHTQSLKIQSLGFLPEHVTYEEYGRFQGLDMVACRHLMSHVRMIKDQEEIAKIRNACQLSYEGFDFLKACLEKGVTEAQLARELAIFGYQKGAEELSFTPIIGYGAHSSHPHYHPQQIAFEGNGPVQFDWGFCVQKYHSDLSRVVCVGHVDDEFFTIRALVEKAKEEVVKIAKPGIPLRDLDLRAREVIACGGYGDYFPHSLGHGVGLQVHEFPVLSEKMPQEMVLEQGCVVTIEPGIYLPGKFGVRLEDTYVITQEGPECLTGKTVC